MPTAQMAVTTAKHNLGDVTIVLSKKRRNDGPKGVKILVTNLTEASAGVMATCMTLTLSMPG